VAKRKRIDKSLFDPSIEPRHRSPKHLKLIRELFAVFVKQITIFMHIILHLPNMQLWG